MITSRQLLDMIHAAIVLARTEAGDRVFRPGTWPSQAEAQPQIKLRLFSERRSSLSRSGAPQFTTVATIRAFLEVQEPASEEDFGAGNAEAAVWDLKREVEIAVVNSYPLTRAIQQIAAIRSQVAFNSEGARHLAMVVMDFDLEFFEDTDNFAPIVLHDVDEMALTPTHYPPASVTADLTK